MFYMIIHTCASTCSQGVWKGHSPINLVNVRKMKLNYIQKYMGHRTRVLKIGQAYIHACRFNKSICT